MVAEEDIGPKYMFSFDVWVGRSIYSVTLQSSKDPARIIDLKVTPDRPVEPNISDKTASDIIELCELSREAEKAGLTKGDMRRAERRFIIKPTA